MSEHSIRNQEKRAIPAQLESALIISVKEARKIMGVDARPLSDDELILAVWHLMEISTELLNSPPPNLDKQL